MAAIAPSSSTPIPSYIITNLKRIPYKAVLIVYIPMIAMNYLKGTASTATLSFLVFGAAAGAFIGSKAYTNKLVKNDSWNNLIDLKLTATVGAVVGTIFLGILPLLLRNKLF
ncbi:MAG: hypothetical protein KR126chlam4_00343 [Candidatus Anoxychlamydiales bacterium]|uniref:Uncharacterized protein n=1 Tax=marine sediment metagenome TaxID=412755 RepID=A0A0F9K144_9ZZZZ|nr:hypothetical protein [Candidatus Anoxychlamydiales bacterium]NGX40521.1 hypothetical protein [Candidatus Anoxychlamydiales bacterium]HEU64516.1 hypothetical protein [Chlamydiota bacterium]